MNGIQIESKDKKVMLKRYIKIIFIFAARKMILNKIQYK